MTLTGSRSDRGPGLDHGSSVAAVQQLYDRWAPIYDWNPVLDLVRPARRQAVELMDLSPGDTVVDMGTGTGANLPFLRDGVGPNGHVIGIDISPRMLERARERVTAAGWDNVSLLEADIRKPPLDGPVDGILSAFVVVMYEAPDQLIETWTGFLSDGSLANLYAGPSSRWYAPAVNSLLSVYLRVFEDGWNTSAPVSGPLDVLAARGRRARSALQTRCKPAEHHDLVLGLAHLDVGRVDLDAQ